MNARSLLAGVISIALLSFSGCAPWSSAPALLGAARAARGSGAGNHGGTGLVVSDSDTGYNIDSTVKGANVAFNYLLKVSCTIESNCYEIDASTGAAGIPASAPGKCHVAQGNASTPTVVQCPAVGGTVFHMQAGGTWAGYAGGGGMHADGPCSPGKNTVYTASASGTSTSVNAWNGCHDTIVCVKAKNSFTGVQADKFDVVHGKCSSIIRY